jgi:hypothetical protein
VHSLDVDVMPFCMCALFALTHVWTRCPYTYVLITVLRVQVQNHIKGVHACEPNLSPSASLLSLKVLEES